MRGLFLVLSISLIINSCSIPSIPSFPSSDYSWQFKLDGVLYKSECGASQLDDAFTNYESNNSVLNLQKGNLSVSIGLPSNSTGNFVISNTSYQTSNMMIFFNYSSTDIKIYRTHGSIINAINVNVNSLSVPGKIKGTFNGTIENPNGQLSTVSEGRFEVETSE
jgi:hypothetical protein